MLEIFKLVLQLIRSPREAWKDIIAADKDVRSMQNGFFYPLLGFVVLATFIGSWLNSQNFAFDQALKECVVVFSSFFAGYYFAILMLNEVITWRSFGLKKDYVSCVRLITYTSSVMLTLKAVVSLWQDLFILYVINLYAAYIIWEGLSELFPTLGDAEAERMGVKRNFTIVCMCLIYIFPFLMEKLMMVMMS
ncbi:MAG: YIP1 family protein [Paludibacteraceae bacterium]|nr:YIP1 family protein [Paludibacteraceae bacterium]